jgi:hypothetical protein
MTSNQEDTLTMYYAVKSANERFQATWSTNAVYAATHNQWAAKVVLIEQNRDVQTVENAGVTEDKQIKKGLMVDKALFIQNRLLSYANVTNNVELAASVHYSKTKMKNARDTDIVSICNVILSKATANATAIATYGVTAAMITELQTAITTYTGVMAKPISVKSQTKNATENLARLFKEADDILKKRMDLDIELFKVTKPDFYSQYQTARIVIATKGSATSVLGSAVEANSGQPIKGASFEFTPDKNGLSKIAAPAAMPTVVKKSAAKGSFRISNLPEGTYMVTVRKLGYKDQVITINVLKGETTTLKIELERN